MAMGGIRRPQKTDVLVGFEPFTFVSALVPPLYIDGYKEKQLELEA